MKRLVVLPLALTLVLSSMCYERDAEASMFELWLQVQGGGLAGAGSTVFEGAGMPFYGLAGGVEVFWVDVFVDLRLEDITQDENGQFNGGTWNQIGLGFDYPLIDDDIYQIAVGGRVAYVYSKMSKASQEAYLDRLEENNELPREPENKGLNISSQVELNLKLGTPYLLLGISADIGYHLLLPNLEMGVNFQGLGYLRLNIDFFAEDKTPAFE